MQSQLTPELRLDGWNSGLRVKAPEVRAFAVRSKRVEIDCESSVLGFDCGHELQGRHAAQRRE